MRTQETSLQAYDDAKLSAQVKRTIIHRLLLGYLPAGRTGEEIEDELGWPHQGTSARTNELMLMGYVEQRNEDRRTNRSGKTAIVWYAVPEHLAVPIEKAEKPIRIVAKALYSHLRLVEAAKGDPAALARLAVEATSVLVEADKVLHPVAKPTRARAARGGTPPHGVPGGPRPTHAGSAGSR